MGFDRSWLNLRVLSVLGISILLCDIRPVSAAIYEHPLACEALLQSIRAGRVDEQASKKLLKHRYIQADSKEPLSSAIGEFMTEFSWAPSDPGYRSILDALSPEIAVAEARLEKTSLAKHGPKIHRDAIALVRLLLLAHVAETKGQHAKHYSALRRAGLNSGEAMVSIVADLRKQNVPESDIKTMLIYIWGDLLQIEKNADSYQGTFQLLADNVFNHEWDTWATMNDIEDWAEIKLSIVSTFPKSLLGTVTP